MTTDLVYEIGFGVIATLVGVVYTALLTEIREIKALAAHHQTALTLICDKLGIKLGE
jgi:hypothetical protein